MSDPPTPLPAGRIVATLHLPIGLKSLVTIMRTLVREHGKTLTQHATGDVMTFILPES